MPAPYFRLKGRRCECSCGGQGVLTLITCPGCGHVALACDEVGTVFPDPHDLTKPSCGSWLLADGSRAVCPKCGKVPLAEFEYSTGEELQSAGLSADEYE